MEREVFEWVYVACFIVGSIVRGIYTRHRRSSHAMKRVSGALDTLLLGVASLGCLLPIAYLFTPWLDFANYELPWWLGCVGGAVFAIAVWLLWRSHVDLGRNWSPKPEILEAQSLVTEGVYRRIRHPMYAAHLLWGIAQILLLWNWIAGPALLVTFAPLYFVRVPREEELLVDHFGEDYREYMKRTGRSVPRIW